MVAVVACALLVLVPACGRGNDAEACGPEQQEPLHTGSATHVLPGSPPPSYLSDPPTSGPHQLGPAPAPVVDEPIPAPLQVGLLEIGTVLIQHQGLARPEVAELAELAGDHVVIAPGRDLPERVVATAWQRKLSCPDIDRGRLERFIDDHAGEAAGH